MKAIYVLGLLILCSLRIEAQTYTLKDLEKHFLENNFYLVSKKFQIAESEAKVVQEKLLPNPELSVSEVNLWANSTSETLPYIIGKSGKTQQLAIELEQLIETAGKRKKRVAIKEAEVKQSVFEFEETLRELKKDLRLAYWNLHFTSENQKQVAYLLNLYQQLSEQYVKQANLQNTSQVNAYRTQTAFVNLQSENAKLIQNQIEILRTIRVLTQIPELKIEDIVFSKPEISAVPIALKDWINEENIVLKIQDNRIELAEKQLLLEKSMAKPDVYVSINYDRGGNIMQNFVGVGLRMDLPVFNKNKGNILAAKKQVQLQNQLSLGLKNDMENSLTANLEQLNHYENLIKSQSDLNGISSQTLLENYLKHLQNKQVTLMEFLDFAQSYLEAKQTQNEWFNNYISIYEQLQYLAGKDFK